MGHDVTVVIPTLPTREVLLRRAVRSVEGQTAAPDAVVVEVDAQRTGAAATRNRALEKVNTTWVAFLDDDDEFLPNHLRVLLDGAHATGADLVYSYPLFIGMRDPLATTWNGLLCSPLGVPFGAEQEQYLRQVGNFVPVTHLCRTESVRAVGGFPEQGSFPLPEGNNSGECEDYGLLLRLLDAGAKFAHIPEVTWRYNFHEGNTGGKP